MHSHLVSISTQWLRLTLNSKWEFLLSDNNHLWASDRTTSRRCCHVRSILCQGKNESTNHGSKSIKSSPIFSGQYNRETSDFNGPILSYVWLRSYWVWVITYSYSIRCSILLPWLNAHKTLNFQIKPISESYMDSYQFINSIQSIISTNQLSNHSQSFI